MLGLRTSILGLLGLVLLPAAPAAGEDAGSLDALVAELVAASKLKPASVTVAIVDPATGAVLGEHRGNERVMAASCMKVVTTAAALTALGPDYPLKTQLLAPPPGRGPEASVVPGDLWLVGYGDPGFSEHGAEGSTTAAMDAFAAQASSRGVRTVRGDLVFDASFFDGPRVHPSWTDAGASARWYAAEVDALSCNDGCIDVAVEPGEGPGSAGRVRLLPETAAVTVVNRTTTTAARKDHGFGFRLAGADNTLEVFGKVWSKSKDAKSPASIRDPALLCAEQVGRALARAGIRVTGVVRRPKDGETRPAGLALLAEHRTPLSAACAVANTRSQNLWAETILRVLGAVRKGEGSFAAGSEAVREVLGPEIAGGIRQVDGSGLSREGESSALAMARVLAFAWKGDRRDAFFGGLARPGTGTLDNRFLDARFEGRVFAKTGTLKGVSGLCGLAVGHSGRSYVFAVLGEHVDVGRCRKLQNDVVGALVGFPGNAARR